MSTREDMSLEAYVDAAIRHTSATMGGNFKLANKAHAIAAIYRARRARGLAAQLELLPLLQHETTGVRTWTASHALEFAPEQALPVLEELASDEGIIGFNAQTTLSEWRAGRLIFP